MNNKIIYFLIPFCISFTIFLLQLSAHTNGISPQLKISWVFYAVIASIIPSILLGFIGYYAVRFFKRR